MRPSLISPIDQELDWIREDLVRWHKSNRRSFPWRRKSTSLYQHVITEILLQRTKAETVAAFYQPFFSRFRNWNALSAAPIRVLQDVLKPIGLWKRRSQSIHKLATIMSRRRGRFPDTRSELYKLPAVGQYVANSILLFKEISREPLLDSGMARVIERCFGPRDLADIRYDPKLQETARRLVDCEDALELNWALLDLAATVCRPSNPECSMCPLSKRCRRARLLTHQVQ